MINQEYKERVRLLLRIIPIISTEEYFAVHGGTAINLFVQNLPRYSVDIDLTYIPVEPREASLAHIKERLKAVKAKIEAAIPGIAVREVPNKLICTHNGHFVKVEVNDVKRGIIAPPVELPLCDLAQESPPRASVATLWRQDHGGTRPPAPARPVRCKPDARLY